MDEQRRRQAENELFFRSINERIEDVGADLFEGEVEGPRVHDFVCECRDTACVARIPLTIAEYEAVRSDGRRFLVAPGAGHVEPAVERVVDRSSRYWVVEKTDEAGAVAEAEDPRA
jgi:hypothetical protein